MGILWTIIIGFVAGVVAKFLMPGPNEPSGFILTTILGIVGAFVASYLGQALGWYGPVKVRASLEQSSERLLCSPFGAWLPRTGHFELGTSRSFPSVSFQRIPATFQQRGKLERACMDRP